MKKEMNFGVTRTRPFSIDEVGIKYWVIRGMIYYADSYRLARKFLEKGG